LFKSPPDERSVRRDVVGRGNDEIRDPVAGQGDPWPRRILGGAAARGRSADLIVSAAGGIEPQRSFTPMP
jgi:hypothetical protein